MNQGAGIVMICDSEGRLYLSPMQRREPRGFLDTDCVHECERTPAALGSEVLRCLKQSAELPSTTDSPRERSRAWRTKLLATTGVRSFADLSQRARFARVTMVPQGDLRVSRTVFEGDDSASAQSTVRFEESPTAIELGLAILDRLSVDLTE